MNQGYPQDAKKELQNTLQKYSAQLQDTILLYLKVHLAFATVGGCGEDWTDESPLEELKRRLDEHSVSNLKTDDDMEALAHYCKIAIVRQNFCLRQDDPAKADVALLTGGAMQQAMSQQRYLQMWMILEPFRWTLTTAETRSFLAEVVEMPMPSRLKASFLQIRAELAEGQDKGEWLDRADEAYQACGHETGRMLVRRSRLYHGLENSQDIYKDLLTIMSDLLPADWPLAALKIAPDALSIAVRTADISRYIRLHNTLHLVCRNLGIEHEGSLLELQVLATLNTAVGRNSTVLELSNSLLVDFKRRKWWSLVYLTGHVRCIALLNSENVEASEELALELQHLCLQEGLQTLSDSHFLYAMIRARSLQQIEDPTERLTQARRFCNDLEEWIEDDLATSARDLAAQKLCLLADEKLQIIFASTQQTVRDATVSFERVIDRARQCVDTSTVTSQLDINSKCDQHVARLYMWQARNHNNTLEQAAIDIHGLLIQQYLHNDLRVEAATAYFMRALCHHQCYQNALDFDSQIRSLTAEVSDLEEAIGIYSQLDVVEMLQIAQHALARVFLIGYNINNNLKDQALERFAQLEDTLQRERRELSIIGSLQALLQKQRFAARGHTVDLYAWATAIGISSNDAVLTWTWTQKRKARGLVDMLGLGVILPEEVRHALANSTQATEALKELTILSHALDVAPSSDKVYIRQKIEDAELILRSFGPYEGFRLLQDGEIRRFEGLARLASVDARRLNSQRDIIFVDWFVHNGGMYMTTVNAANPELSYRLTSLNINESYIRDWIARHFGTPGDRRNCLENDDLDLDDTALRELDVLLSGLESVSRNGDLLILCPTSVISSLPLHLLRLHDGERSRKVPLIQRNPITYTPSFPVLELCLTRNVMDHMQRKPVFLGVYDEGNEARRIYSHLQDLAVSTGGQSFCGDSVTRATFADRVSNANLIHFHGHCHFDVQQALRQGLVLASANVAHSEEPNNLDASSTDKVELSSPVDLAAIVSHTSKVTAKNESEGLLGREDDESSSHLTVEDIFRLQLAGAPVVMIACESASQTLSTGDEPLGLVSSMLCAGSPAVIGATWRIPSRAGRAFSKHFYSQLSASGNGALDLAVLVQQAVLEMMDDQDDPTLRSAYYWGGFCLTGAWILEVGGDH